jgi:hypothetical protein
LKVKRMPPAAGTLVWILGAVAMHGVISLELSRLGDGVEQPGKTRPAVRSAGLLMVAVGASLMACAYAAHYQAAPRAGR